MALPVVGIDPSGRRLALAAAWPGHGRLSLATPPASHDLRADRDPARFEEAEKILAEYVVRNGLAGAPARLAVPADKVYAARVVLPRLPDRDLHGAVEMELERLFPLPPARIRFRWRRIGDGPGPRSVSILVLAAERAFLERWEQAALRAGLRLEAAVPAGEALAAALSRAGAGAPARGRAAAVLRDIGGGVEATVLAAGTPVFTSSRPCPPEGMAQEGADLLAEGLSDGIPGGGEEVFLVAPAAWEVAARGVDPPLRTGPDLETAAADALVLPGPAEENPPAWRIAGAAGAAILERGLDLMAIQSEGPARRVARATTAVLAAAAVAAALAWPSASAWRTRSELARLDAAVAAARPGVAEVERLIAELELLGEREAALREAAAGRGEPLELLRELTDRLPAGTWLTGVRLEERKVEFDGLSPSASEIFPALTRDGRFAGVEFGAPITRQPDNLERFKIRAEFVPRGGAPRDGGGR